VPERIQKVLAAAGAGSRRYIEGLIKEGRIRVNGNVAKPGDKIARTDRVKIDKRVVKLDALSRGEAKVLAYYKPEGEICTEKDPQGRRTVFKSLPGLEQGRWISIGRLDINSCGLLLFTNDGSLANKLMHPASQVEREYAVRVLGRANEGQINALLKGVMLEDGMANFAKIEEGGGRGSNHWYHVVIMRGRNREVRRLWESQGMAVSRLIRIRYGPYALPRSKCPGQYWDLTEKEIKSLIREINS